MAAPPIPRNVVAQQANGEILITWDPPSGATQYDVERSTDNITFASVATPTTPEYHDTNVTIGTQYYYRVNATDGVNTSAFSSVVFEVPVQTGEMSLGQLRRLAKQKADRENSQFITDAEWNVYLNQSYFELYDLLVQKYGNEYFVADPLELPLTGSSSVDLPDGTNYNGAPAFYKVLGVDLALNAPSDAFVTLQRFDFIERNRFVYPQLGNNALGASVPKYRVVGNQLRFIPTPSGGQSLRLWYIPRLTMLLKDTDIADGVSGWTEYIVVDAAIKALQKEESDVTVLAAQKMALIQRVEAAAENRDAGLPDTVSDSRDPWGSGYNGPFSGPWGGY